MRDATATPATTPIFASVLESTVDKLMAIVLNFTRTESNPGFFTVRRLVVIVQCGVILKCTRSGACSLHLQAEQGDESDFTHLRSFRCLHWPYSKQDDRCARWKAELLLDHSASQSAAERVDFYPQTPQSH